MMDGNARVTHTIAADAKTKERGIAMEKALVSSV